MRKKFPQATVTARNGMTIADLKDALNKGNLVQVAYQAWPDGPVDYKTDNDDGHYSVVIGYDNDHLYFMDPSTIGSYTYIPHQEFMDRWHDVDGTNNEPVINFGIECALNQPFTSPYDPKNLLKLTEPPQEYPAQLRTTKPITLSPVLTVPKTYQSANWTALFACLQSILFFYGVEYRQDALAERLGITDNVLAHNMLVDVDEAKITEFCLEELKQVAPNALVNFKQNMDFGDLKEIVDQKNPVLVMLKPWSDAATTNRDSGRYAVAIGHNNDQIILMDPSVLGNYVYCPQEEFMKRWLKMGIVFSGAQPKFNPGAYTKID